MQNLSDVEKKWVRDARTQCPRIAVVRGELHVAAMPKLDGQEVISTDETFKRKGDLNDRDIIAGVWYQRACLLSKLDSQFKDVEASRSEISRAAGNWPTFDAASYEKLIINYQSQKEAHIADIRKKYANSVPGEAIPLPVLNAVMPYRDFLNITTIDVDVVAGEKFILKGQKIGGSTAKVCLKGNEYSTAIRPALDQTRTAAIAIGRGKMTSAEGIEMMVTSVYEAGTIRLLDAKEASDRQTAPVNCAIETAQSAPQPAVPKEDQTKPTAGKKSEMPAPADKKTGETDAGNNTVARVPSALSREPMPFVVGWGGAS